MRFSVCAVLFVSCSFCVSAQQSAPPSGSQPDALAAAARQAREQKKDQPKPARVWTNDNIPKGGGEITVLKPSPSETAAPDSSANVPADNKSAASAGKDSAARRATLEADLASAKDNLQTLQDDLDILKRKYALDQQTYYSKPNYSTDKEGAAALSDEQGQIDAKQLDMGAAQQKISDLQAQLNALAESKPADTTKTTTP